MISFRIVLCWFFWIREWWVYVIVVLELSRRIVLSRGSLKGLIIGIFVGGY